MSSTDERAQLLSSLEKAIRENSNATVLLHASIAEHIGLTVSDLKTVDVLNRLGALTAKEIAQYTGLTTASVTKLIDRLEEKGFAQRTRDTEDRRRVIVTLNPQRQLEIEHAFDRYQAALHTMLEAYSAQQIKTITAFLQQAARSAREELSGRASVAK